METKIIGISGRSESGKTGCSNLVLASIMSAITVEDTEGNPEYLAKVALDENGSIVVDTDNELIDGGKGILSSENRDPSFLEWMALYVDPFVRVIPLASTLKEFATDVLGCNYYDLITQEGKNKLSHLTWRNMPVKPPKGVSLDDYVTNRRVLQIWGEKLRSLQNNIWEDRWYEKVQLSNSELVVVSDIRHVSSVEYIRGRGGKVVRLTRNVNNDNDPSETNLDNYDGFDFVIQNDNLSMEETHKIFFSKLVEWNFLEVD